MRHQREIEQIREMLERRPADARLWLKLAHLLESADDPEAAAEAFARVARCYEDDGDFVKAIATQKHILELRPGAIRQRHALARQLLQFGATAEAIAQLQTCLEQYALSSDGEGTAVILAELARLGSTPTEVA